MSALDDYLSIYPGGVLTERKSETAPASKISQSFVMDMRLHFRYIKVVASFRYM